MSSPNDNQRNESYRKEIEKCKKEIEELKKEKNNLEDINKKLENEKKDLEEKIEKITDDINIKDKIFKNEYNEEFVGKKLEEFYDIVINIKSIYSLATPEGWPIKWNPNRKEIQNLIKNKELLKIGILGNGNIGKSFLLSRLLGDCIPSGYSVITEGLSIKFNCDKGYTILDSAGLQTPLVIGDNMNYKEDDVNLKRSYTKDILKETVVKDYENLYRDKTQTENFIQNLILYLSDMLLIVVGKITFNEQRLINKIKKEIELSSKDDKKKQIFIIHNLLNFQRKHQVESHIKDTLMKSASFKLLEKKDIVYSDKKGVERLFFVEKDKGFQTYHLIIARENTEAGDYYNQYTYDFLKEKFNNFTLRRSLSIIDEVKDRFIDWSNDLLEEKIRKDDLEIVKDKDNNMEKCYIFKGDKKKLEPKVCLSDELGFSIYRSNGYEPPYNFYLDEKENKLVLNIEIPGNIKIDDCYAFFDTKEIIVVGNKKDEIENIKPIKNTRKFGKFNLHIPYGNKIIITDEESIHDKNTDEKNGTFTYKFNLAKRRIRENNQ